MRKPKYQKNEVLTVFFAISSRRCGVGNFVVLAFRWLLPLWLSWLWKADVPHGKGMHLKSLLLVVFVHGLCFDGFFFSPICCINRFGSWKEKGRPVEEQESRQMEWREVMCEERECGLLL